MQALLDEHRDKTKRIDTETWEWPLSRQPMLWRMPLSFILFSFLVTNVLSFAAVAPSSRGLWISYYYITTLSTFEEKNENTYVSGRSTDITLTFSRVNDSLTVSRVESCEFQTHDERGPINQSLNLKISISNPPQWCLDSTNCSVLPNTYWINQVASPIIFLCFVDSLTYETIL